MKTYNEIINHEPVYLHSWNEKIDLIGDFENIYMTAEEYRQSDCTYPNEEYFHESKRKMDKAIKQYEDVNILFASYGEDNYSGDAWVLFEEKGKLYEVNGSHCSCYGLEGQWEPEEVTLEALEYRLINGELGKDDWSGNEFNDELKDFLGIK